MATSSIYTDVKIKNRLDCLKLVSALENAKQKKVEEVKFSRPVETVKGETIKELFK